MSWKTLKQKKPKANIWINAIYKGEITAFRFASDFTRDQFKIKYPDALWQKIELPEPTKPK